jgi:putative FmdB family regulatory protein
MPIYEYRCESCGKQHEILQKVSDGPPRSCPSCGKRKLKRLMSAPRFRLKGSGWYETDFKSDKDKKRNLAESGTEGKVSGGDGAGGDGSSSSAGEKTSEKAGEKPGAKSAEKSAEKSDSKSGDTGSAPVKGESVTRASRKFPRQAKRSSARKRPGGKTT